MEADRRAAIIAGILFIIATVLGLASTALTSSVLGASDYLTKIYSSQNQIVLGALFQFVASVACAGIAISLYPVLKRYNEGLALGSVGLRIIEAVFGIITALCLLSLVTLSQDFVNAGSPPGSDYQTLGTLIKAVSNWFWLRILGTGIHTCRANLLLHLLSNETHSSMAGRVGINWGRTLDERGHLGRVRRATPLNALCGAEHPNRSSGDDLGSLADSKGIRSFCPRIPRCQADPKRWNRIVARFTPGAASPILTNSSGGRPNNRAETGSFA